MGDTLKDLVSSWNSEFPGFEMKINDLYSPKPMFFIGVVLEVLKRMDIQLDSLLKSIQFDDNVTEMTYRHIYPLIQLTEAFNCILTEISPEGRTITVYDFIKPVPYKIQTVLIYVLNFVLFIRDRKERVVEKEKGIVSFMSDVNNFKTEVENAKERIDDLYMGNEKKRQYLKEMEKQIAELKKENHEPESRVNGLKTEFDLIQEEKERIQAKLNNRRSVQTSLVEKVNKLKSCIISEEELASLSKTKEAAAQRSQEVDEKLKDIRITLVKKKEDIKLFRNNVQVFKKGEELLMDLKDLYNKIELVERCNETFYDDEKKLREIKEKINLIQRNYSELISNKEQQDEEIATVTDSLSKQEKELEMQEIHSKNYVEKLNSSIKKINGDIDDLKHLTREYNEKYERILGKQEEIPKIYDKQIEEQVDRIKNLIEKVRRYHEKFDLSDF